MRGAGISLSTESQPQQPPRVPFVNLLSPCGRQGHLVETADGFANVCRTALGIERHVARKQNTIDTEEFESTFHRMTRTEQCRVGVEHPEIIERAVTQAM